MKKVHTLFFLNSFPYRESIPRRNRFLTGNQVRGIDAWGPEKFKNSDSGTTTYALGIHGTKGRGGGGQHAWASFTVNPLRL
jgi:hypothetical protein